jgi:hypothetical protein
LAASDGSGSGRSSRRRIAMWAAMASIISRSGPGASRQRRRLPAGRASMPSSPTHHHLRRRRRALHWRSVRRPARFRMLNSVFGFKVALGLPATVTSPGFTGWLKCRCEPGYP